MRLQWISAKSIAMNIQYSPCCIRNYLQSLISSTKQFIAQNLEYMDIEHTREHSLCLVRGINRRCEINNSFWRRIRNSSPKQNKSKKQTNPNRLNVLRSTRFGYRAQNSLKLKWITKDSTLFAMHYAMNQLGQIYLQILPSECTIFLWNKNWHSSTTYDFFSGIRFESIWSFIELRDSFSWD